MSAFIFERYIGKIDVELTKRGGMARDCFEGSSELGWAGLWPFVVRFGVAVLFVIIHSIFTLRTHFAYVEI